MSLLLSSADLLNVEVLFFCFVLFCFVNLKQKTVLTQKVLIIATRKQHSREINFISISYSWSLSHTPEIDPWSALLCREGKNQVKEWDPASSHREEQTRVATHWDAGGGVIVTTWLQRP